MSHTVDIILIVSSTDEDRAQELAFWMGTRKAVDDRAVDIVRSVAANLAETEGPVETSSSLETVGSLLPLNGPVGEDLWGGWKNAPLSIWGSITSNLNWSRFLAQVADSGWRDPDRVQLLMKDDGDSYFRMYMFRDGALINVVPPPPDEGFDIDW